MAITIHTAYTAPVNASTNNNNPSSTPSSNGTPMSSSPPSPSFPRLSHAHLWAGLQRKVRRAQDFVPAIVACEVEREEQGGRVVERWVRFKEGREVRERCVAVGGWKVDFQQPDGSTITNLISTGAGGQDDLYLTYIFEWRHPELSADASDEIAKLQAKHDAMAKMAVEKSIESIRKMVAEGVIQEKEGEGWRDIVS
ncbi:uncharacterized protein J3D65DRAFT_636467 [Phyllosticta citribraziliensis]|uniref:Uncharacterized protein n=1 Tax=Phyllosticta citribraziliensis TaxID=989973 RepID=A0ABR1LAR3_9PEZI